MKETVNINQEKKRTQEPERKVVTLSSTYDSAEHLAGQLLHGVLKYVLLLATHQL